MLVVGKDFVPRPQCVEVQTLRALIHTDRGMIQQEIRVQAALARKPTCELGVRQCIKQPHHADRNSGLLDEFDNGIRDRTLLAVEANDEARTNVQPSLVKYVDALGYISPCILLFSDLAQRTGVWSCDTNKNSDE